jgi:hypothetical protein
MFSLCAHAMQPQSNIISFQDLVTEAIQLVPRQQLTLNAQNINETKNTLRSNLHEQAFEFVNKLYENHAFRPYIIPIKDDLEKAIEFHSQNIDMQFIDIVYNTALRQVFAYLVLHRALNTYPNVIVCYSMPGSCDFFDAVIKDCAQEHTSRVQFIIIDPAKYAILALPVDIVPALIFFHNGKEVYRQMRMDVDAVSKKFTEHDTPNYKFAVFRFLQEQINLSIQKYLLS